jgi:hypothetical protein
MKDMSISIQEKKEESSPSVVDDKPRYPYGLKIHFDPKSFDKLGLEGAPKVGEKFMMMAMVEVCDVHQEKMADDVPEIGVGMQITSLELKESEKEKSTEDKLYGDMD